MLWLRTEKAMTCVNGDQISPCSSALMWSNARVSLIDSTTSRISIAFKVVFAEYATIKAQDLATTTLIFFQEAPNTLPAKIERLDNLLA